VNSSIKPDNVQFVKILAEAKAQTDRINLAQVQSSKNPSQTLEVMGFSQEGEVLFQYIN
jgi:hypothetical protein